MIHPAFGRTLKPFSSRTRADVKALSGELFHEVILYRGQCSALPRQLPLTDVHPVFRNISSTSLFGYLQSCQRMLLPVTPAHSIGDGAQRVEGKLSPGSLLQLPLLPAPWKDSVGSTHIPTAPNHRSSRAAGCRCIFSSVGPVFAQVPPRCLLDGVSLIVLCGYVTLMILRGFF